MKKKCIIGISILLLLSVSMLCIPFLKPITINGIISGYRYIVYADDVSIIGYNRKSESVTIPSYLFARPVTRIGWGSFEKNETIQNLKISDTVEIVDEGAFRECASLKSVVLGKNVKEIRAAAFSHCEELKEVILNEHLNRIGNTAFAYTKNLQDITITEKVEIIEEMAFGNSGLENVTFNGNATRVECSAFDKTPLAEKEEFAVVNEEVLVAYNGTDEIVIVPNGIKCISGSFYYNSNVREIYLPETVEEIQTRATPRDGTSIKIYIPESVTVFGTNESSRVFDIENTTIVTTENSQAEQYAKEKGIKYEIVQEIDYPIE